MKNRLNVMNEKTQKAINYWYSLTPINRAKIMNKVNSQKKTIKGQFGDIIKYIEKTYILVVE